VEYPGRGSAQIMGCDVAQAGGLGPPVDDVEEGPRPDPMLPVNPVGPSLARRTQDLGADQWVGRFGPRYHLGITENQVLGYSRQQSASSRH